MEIALLLGVTVFVGLVIAAGFALSDRRADIIRSRADSWGPATRGGGDWLAQDAPLHVPVDATYDPILPQHYVDQYVNQPEADAPICAEAPADTSSGSCASGGID